MVDENYSSCTKTGPNNGNYKPDESRKSQKREKRGKGSESERKKRLATVFSFYSVDFGDTVVLNISVSGQPFSAIE